MPKNNIIREINITKKSKIIISTVKLSGKEKLDIRLWYWGLNKKVGSKIEEWLPTWKGVNLPIAKRKELIKGLQEIIEPEKDICEEGEIK